MAIIKPPMCAEIGGGVESWTLETLHEKYLYKELNQISVHAAMQDRERLFDLMEFRGVTDPKILEMTEFLMSIRSQFVANILDEADRQEANARYLRSTVRNV